ncbi:hypothetical protein [Mycetocola spongiae]|uniref:hypothetical protein n=1 Tax=Mycetocola spongiae TaxID=2859226 RepID=UPI001CF244DA|nr:hypothetical protein [Mycetocola spongiae]UCR87936.1 hypothetical protein KXZ72_07885 [Mycetocola spongiae]
MSSVLLLGIILLCAAALGCALWLLRGPRAGEPGATRVRVTRVLALIYTVFTALGTIILVLNTLLAPTVSVRLPVAPFWPTLPPGAQIEGPTASVVGGGFLSADVQVEGLTVGTRVLLAVESLGTGVLLVTLGALILLLCSNLLAGKPFTGTLVRALGAAAGIVLLAGFALQICGDLGAWRASAEALSVTSASWPATVDLELLGTPYGQPLPTERMNVSLWPIAVSLVLLVLAGLIRAGSRLQRDSEGLI